MYHVYVDNDPNSPYMMDGQDILNQFLSNQPSTAKVVVTQYDMIQRETTVYGVTGGEAIPGKQKNPIALQNINRIHIHKK